MFMPSAVVMTTCSFGYCANKVVAVQGALALLNVETGLETVSEIEAIGAFVVMLLLTEDIHKDSKQ